MPAAAVIGTLVPSAYMAGMRETFNPMEMVSCGSGSGRKVWIHKNCKGQQHQHIPVMQEGAECIGSDIGGCALPA
jgi:hypothetical protein